MFVQDQQIVAGYGCADEAGGSGLSTCAGPVIDGHAIDTSIGSHRFEVKASDVQGNTATASTGYIVFSDLGGSLTTSTARRAGFWETLDLGLGLTRPADALLFVAPGYPRSQQVSCADPSQVLGEPELADVKLQLKQGRTGRPVANRPGVDRLMPCVRAAIHPRRVERHRRRLRRPVRHRAVETLTPCRHD